MADLAFTILDVFTKASFTGNPLAVVPEADGLTTVQMQTIARQFNLSETVFLMAPDNPAHTARVRIFTPTFEMPFAGHPTVGAAIYLAEERFGRGENRDAILVLEENVGPVRCAVTVLPDGASYAEFDTPKAAAPAGPDPAASVCARALDLLESDIGFDRHQPSMFSAGAVFAYVPVGSVEALGRARPSAGFADAAGGAVGVVVYARLPENDPFAYQVRMFAPDAGVYEDPATGSAAAGFAGVLGRFEPLPEGRSQHPVAQGVEMGRRSEIAVELEVENGAILNCRIGGHAVRTASGRMARPD